MNASGAIGYTLAVPIARESYAIERDAGGTAYAFRMDEDARERLVSALDDQLGARRTDVVDVAIEPGYLRLDVEPDLRTPLTEYTGEIVAAVRTYNDQEADHSAEQLQLVGNQEYAGVYRPEGTRPLSGFVDGLDRDAYRETPGFEEKDGPVFTWEREHVDENAAGGDGRHVAFECVVPLDPSTYATPGGFAKGSATFRWEPRDPDQRDPLAYIRDRAGRVLGEWGSLTDLTLWPTHARLTIRSGSVALTPQGIARGSDYHLHAVTPPAVAFCNRAHVAPLDPADGPDAWLDRHAPTVDGEPFESKPDESEDAEDGGGGLLSSLLT